MLYNAASDPDQGFRWRNRGATPSPSAFQNQLFANTLVQFIVESRGDGLPLGLVAAYQENFVNATAYFALQRLRPTQDGNAGEMIGALYLFLDYLFTTWPFRRLYAEVPGYNWSWFASGEHVFFEVEGLLKEADYHNDLYWDRRIVVVSRAAWTDIKRVWEPVVRPSVEAIDAS